MEKIKLNNQIVSMRKYVKQAKVHVINKLTKQIKLLQNRKGSEVRVQKANRKAQRFLEAVVIVKKIKPDDVSKLVLSRAKDWKSILQQKNSTLHDRCIAMLANYGAVQKEVETFFNANKELVLKIPDYFAQWEEKSKLAKDLPKTNKLLPMKKSGKNTHDANLESLSGSNKIQLKTLSRTKSDAHKNSTALVSVNVGKLALETKGSDCSNADEKIAKNSNKHKNVIQNMKKTEYLCNDKNDSMEFNKLDNIDHESESDENNEEEEINNNSSNKSNNVDDESNSEKTGESDNSNAGNESDENEEKEITSNSLINNDEVTEECSDKNSNINKTQKSVSKFNSEFRMNTNTRNKLKAIALLNLNELEGLDEIPLNNSLGNDECSEEESSEEEINKSSDPFFLGHNKEDSSQNKSSDPFFLDHKKDFNSKELDDSSTDSDADIKTKDSAPSFKNKPQYVKKGFPPRKNEKFNPKKSFQKSPYNHRSDDYFSSKKDFQKSSYNHRKDDHFSPKKNFKKSYNYGKDDHFSPRESFQKSPYNQGNVSNRFKNKDYDEKPFKKGKFLSSNYHNKFQKTDLSKNSQDFKQENKTFPSIDMHNKQSKFTLKSYGNKDDVLPKNKMAFKKGNANEHLHPSWEAKRKQKELLSTSFQGKRMVFND